MLNIIFTVKILDTYMGVSYRDLLIENYNFLGEKKNIHFNILFRLNSLAYLLLAESCSFS